MSTNVNKDLDPYTEKAENTEISTQQKVDDLKKILKTVKAGMMTTRASDGALHSRAMIPCHPTEHSQLTLLFFANNVSQKFDEIHNDPNVNVSFYDEKNTDWVSIAGKARITQDKELIKKHWTRTIAGYFGNLGDGTHKGDENDPRVSIIEVIPDDIHYWKATHGSMSRAFDSATGAVTGKVTAPGELRTITNEEIQLVTRLHGGEKL